VTAVVAPAEVVVDRRAWQVLGVSAAGVFVVFLDATVVNIAFPAMSADFAGTTRAELSWVLNAYAVVFGALLVTAGPARRQSRPQAGVLARAGCVRGRFRAVRPRAVGPAARRRPRRAGRRRRPARPRVAGPAAAGVPGRPLSMVAAQAWFATRTTADASYVTDFLPGSVLAGLAIGFAFSALGAAGAQALPSAAFAVGAAVGATARQLGAVLGVAVLVAVLGDPAPGELLGAFHRSWSAIGVAAVACAVVSLGLGRRRVPTA
jgi:MFS family permease